MVTFELPKPENWQDFEQIACDLYKKFGRILRRNFMAEVVRHNLALMPWGELMAKEIS